jgi:cellobiose phosphorylase
MPDTLTRLHRDRTDRTRTVDAGGGLAVRLTPAGDVAGIAAPGERLVNQYRIGAHDAGIAGLFLRRTAADGAVAHVPLTGSRSGASWRAGDGAVRWSGAGLGVAWTVDLVLDPARTALVWRVALERAGGAADGGAPDGATWDVAATQDLSLAPEQAASSSEPYVSQYVAHRLAASDALGTVVLSRQTMTSAPALPLCALAIAEGAGAAGTDGFDLYGPPARAGHTPAFLSGAPWPDRVRQHEMAMAGLLSRPTALDQPLVLHVVGRYWDDRRGAVLDTLPDVEAEVPGLVALADAAAAAVPAGGPADAAVDSVAARSLLATAPLLGGAPLADADLLALGGAPGAGTGDARHVERDATGRLLSFFTPGGSHVVRGEKDLDLLRPHGHVLLAGDSLSPDRPTLSTTVFAHGVFGSHTVLGNTSFDTLTTVHRNHLNLLRANGVRVLVGVDGAWRMLGAPSAFVLDVGEARWVYDLPGGRVEVRTVAASDRDALLLEVASAAPVDVLVTTEVELGGGAWQAREQDGAVVLVADEGTATRGHHPGLAYVLAATPGADVAGDDPLYADGAPRGTSVVTVRGTAGPGAALRVATTADRDGGRAATDVALDVVDRGLDVAREAAGHRATLAHLTRGLAVAERSRLAELETLLPWWANDARVHYLVPHGLEQYQGAAWGTRDVCQGPFELLLAAGRLDGCRDVVLRVLGAQAVDGTFPQWFMFDAYAEILQEHAHGDVVHWPLFALGQYLRASGDVAVLDAPVPFRTGEPATVADHLDALVRHLETDLVPGTSLPAYGDGDWDDTLQPARSEMRATMASTWTTALAVQALELAAEQLRAAPAAAGLVARMDALGAAIAADLRRHMLPDGIAAGFVTVADGVATPVIHPRDISTGLTYRLIPMTQLVLAGVLDRDGADRHEAIVREHLLFPDGVRLTDRPTRFADGETESFRRAEQAAFFGREVGLMYAHAHIRWAEALAALGRADVADELLRLSPIGMRERVPSALPRQRTCYTSSSDAAFPDRYAAARDFELLRTGEVPTADGWRVYSSGPGIYLRQVLHGLLGLDERRDVLVVGPTLAAEDDGLEVALDLAGSRRTVRYRVDPAATAVAVRVDGRAVPTTPVAHPYRWASAALDLALLDGASVVEVTTPAGTRP